MQTGYRLYDVASLGRLHRLLALRDLGFTLGSKRAAPCRETTWSSSGSVVLHAGFDIGDQDVPTSQRVQVVQLPAVQVASSRELYHEFHHEDPTRHVTELQIPVNS
ncbi:MAG: hypothetical protein ABSH29_17440 [Acidimicrobiales bacterium]|jgi:hypothetical protein